MKTVCNRDECTGCSSCFNVCPTGAITMKDVDFAGYQPFIDERICNGCGQCRRKCPILSDGVYHQSMNVYAAWSRDDEERQSCASGGVASVFSQYIVDTGGLVCGCGFDTDFVPRHFISWEYEQLTKFKGSKYVQSYIGDTFKQIKQQLTRGKHLLFVGTPCQVQGLKTYLGRHYERLLTIDLICHGVPPHSIFREWLSEYDLCHVKGLTFRQNNIFDLKLHYRDDSEMKDRRYYMLGFLNGLFYRTNCYSCRYAKPERVGDLTLGDFWGLGEQVPFEQPTSKGVSLILVNTGKGRDLFERCKSKLEFFERTLDEAINGNEQLRHPAPKHRNYDLFRSSIEKTSFGAATRVCLRREIVKQRIGRFVLRNRTLRLVYRRLRTVVKR